MIEPPEAPLFDRHERNFLETFLLLIAVFASIPLLHGEPGSKLLDEKLDDFTVVLWGTCLLLGCLLILVGQWWPRLSTWLSYSFQRGGLQLLGTSAIVYAFVIWQSADTFTDVSYPFSVHLSFGIACWLQGIYLTLKMRRMKALMKRG